MARLTAKTVENIRPRETRIEVPDSGCRGLYLVVQPSGRKSWAVRYRYQRKPKKLTLGDAVSGLAEARKAATAALHELEQGRDPAALKFDAKAAAERASAEKTADTVEQWSVRFLERHVAKKSAAHRAQAEHVFRNIVLPRWRGRTVHDIKRRDVIDLVEDVAERTPVMGNRVLAHLSKFFNWLCERDVITASPCAGVKAPAKENARERILTDDEIKALWLACDAIGDPAGACIKLLLLTGQRRSECAGMRRSEIVGDTWSLAPERTKNRQRHEVPLSAQALAIVESMPEISDYVFTSGAAPFDHFDRAKRAIDAHMQPAVPWVTHDLRRTCASGLQRLGVQLPVIEKVLNHSSGSFRGVVGTYQKYSFADEKRRALQAWADHVDAVVRGEPTSKVVTLRRGA
jgi:integrase